MSETQVCFDFPICRAPITGVTWDRFPQPCRASYAMRRDGVLTGTQIIAVQHPTALRPYYVALPDGVVLERKFSKLVDAQAAAIGATP